jgi:hypothetical protein
MRRLLFLVLAGVAVGLTLADAQGPAAADARDLPIRRVVLYKSGIGFFEHVGRVTGNQRITVPFTSTQLDDVLKTLTVLDLDGGAVSSVGYNTDTPPARRLYAIGLPIGSDVSLVALLQSLRGARVEVSRGASAVAGRLMSVDQKSEVQATSTRTVDYVSVLSDTGAVHTFELGPATSIRFADPALGRRMEQYLANTAEEFSRQRRALNIVSSGSGTRRLYVSYVSETPVWKATYRVVLPSAAGAKPVLQGWAIVDNTGGNDWSDVELSLVAGAPQSFRQAISQPMYLRRPEVPLNEAFLPTPQADSGAIDRFGTSRGVVTDSSGAALPGATVHMMTDAGESVEVVTDSNGEFDLSGLAGRIQATVSMTGFLTQHVTFDSARGARIALPVGSMSESVMVTAEPSGGPAPPPPPPARIGGSVRGLAKGLGGGSGGGSYRSNLAMPIEQAATRDLGDLFEYKVKSLVTIPRNQSAMVPIVSSPVEVQRVSSWRAADGLPRPRRALWITNTSGLTLDGGSVAVLDHENFAGEGLIETVKPGEKRLLSFALDLAMQVQAEPVARQRPTERVRIARGVMTIDTLVCDQTKYTARNEDTAERQLVIEHPRNAGWQLVEGKARPEEATVSAWRFLVPVGAKSSAALVVSTYRSASTTTMLSNLPDDQLALYVKNAELDEAMRHALAGIQEQRAKVYALASSVARQQQEADAITADQQRLRNNMSALKGSAEEKQLLQRYVAQLNAQEDRLKSIRDERADLERQVSEAQRALTEQIEALTMGNDRPLSATCQ